jgi:hypothetical protein
VVGSVDSGLRLVGDRKNENSSPQRQGRARSLTTDPCEMRRMRRHQARASTSTIGETQAWI